MSDEITTAITDSAKGPKRVKDQQIEVEQHSLYEQIAVDKYIAGKTAQTKAHRGLKISKGVAPSSK
jgi:hypothetical protein